MSIRLARQSASFAALAASMLGASPVLAQAVSDNAASFPGKMPASSATGTAPVEPRSDTGDIVVTAQKREQRLQDVGVTVTAISAEALANRRITTLSDLAQAVPGLVFTQSQTGSPVYTLRGVGFYESTIAAYPDVSTYIDQAPLPLPVTSTLTAFDLERVEVLKGPQGTLFGNNATGGAINFIAVKPKDQFGAGGSISYGRFNTVDVDGYVTGPITSTLNGRIAVKAVRGDDWQKSYTRDDSTGASNSTAARLLLDWAPTDRLKVALNVNGWIDRSDPQSPQLYRRTPQNAVSPMLPIYVYPLSPLTPRATDFTPDQRPSANNKLFQTALRVDYEILPDITLTSISSYLHTKIDARIEYDGSALPAYDITKQIGKIDSFSQELRLASTGKGPFRWVLGGNYERTNVDEYQLLLSTASSSYAANGFGQSAYTTDQRMRNYAAFGNVEFDLMDKLTVKGGIRYTQANRSILARNFEDPRYPDGGPAGGVTNFLNAVWTSLSFLYPNYRPITIGQTFAIDNRRNANGQPLDPALFGTAHDFNDKLNQHNTSWSGGLEYKPTRDILFYANVSKGYKAGSYPQEAASTFTQLSPVVQESLLDYEAGFKTQFADHRVTLNGAAFYYDYRNKQLRAKIVDGIFGLLDGLVNVPKSVVKGAEIELSVRPVQGLTFGVSATYLDTEVRSYNGVVGSAVDPATGLRVSVTQSYRGARLPFSPKYLLAANVDYVAPLTTSLNGLFSVNMSAQSASTSVLALTTADRADYKLPARAIFGGNIGVAASDGRWRATIYGKNIFNKYYIVNSFQVYDDINRYAGRPAEYGVSLGFKI